MEYSEYIRLCDLVHHQPPMCYIERGHSDGNRTDILETQEDNVNAKVKSGQLPTGWEEFKDGEGRLYYVGPGGESSWERPVFEAVSAINMENPSLRARRSSIRRNSIVGKRRGSMRVAAARLAKKDMG